MRAGAAAGGEQLLAHRVVDHRVLEPAALTWQAIDTANTGKPCRKLVVPSSGSMIHSVSCVAAAAAFLGEERMLRIMPADDGDDLPLGGAIDLGDEVVAALGGDGQRLQAVQAADDDLAGTARGAHGDIEKRLHGP